MEEIMEEDHYNIGKIFGVYFLAYFPTLIKSPLLFDLFSDHVCLDYALIIGTVLVYITSL